MEASAAAVPAVPAVAGQPAAAAVAVQGPSFTLQPLSIIAHSQDFQKKRNNSCMKYCRGGGVTSRGLRLDSAVVDTAPAMPPPWRKASDKLRVGRSKIADQVMWRAFGGGAQLPDDQQRQAQAGENAFLRGGGACAPRRRRL